MADLVGRYVKKRKGVDWLEPMLNSWINVVRRYSQLTKGDASYWYTESSNVSTLAAAAWREGWAALCEFQHVKGSKFSKNKWYGRCDLYLHDGTRDFYAEAKQGGFSLTPNREWTEIMAAEMKEAAKDAWKTSANGEWNALAITFWVVYLPESRNHRFKDQTRDLIDHLNSQPFHAAAWCFPKETRDIQFDDGYSIPGVIMGIENVAHTHFVKRKK